MRCGWLQRRRGGRLRGRRLRGVAGSGGGVADLLEEVGEEGDLPGEAEAAGGERTRAGCGGDLPDEGGE